jgi:hypothetical protein
LIYDYLRWRQLLLPGDFALEVGCPVLLFSRIPLEGGTTRTRTTTGPLKVMVEVRNLLAESHHKLRTEAHEMRVFRVRPRADGGTTLSIGRTRENDLVVNHGSVSKHHADLNVSEAEITVIDCMSKNGTEIDGVEVKSPTVIKSGQTLMVGSMPMRFLDPADFFAALTALTEAS